MDWCSRYHFCVVDDGDILINYHSIGKRNQGIRPEIDGTAAVHQIEQSLMDNCHPIGIDGRFIICSQLLVLSRALISNYYNNAGAAAWLDGDIKICSGEVSTRCSAQSQPSSSVSQYRRSLP